MDHRFDQPQLTWSTDEGKGKSSDLHGALVDLPNELLALIFDSLITSDLYKILLVCRRLNYVALPEYLSRQHILVPSISSDVTAMKIGPKIFHRLPPVITSPPFISCNILLCKFSRATLFRDIHRIRLFLSKFLYIRKMTVDFRKVSDKHWPTPDQKEWLGMVLQDVFTAILANSCEEFTVQHGFYFPVGGGTLVRWRRIWSRIGRSLRLCFPPSLPSQEEDTSVPVTKLKTFNIHSTMLLRPPFRDWTIGILNSATITTLSLRAGSALLSPEIWTKILPAITLSSLSNLHISISRRSFPTHATCLSDHVIATLSQFLLRHPSITHFQCRGLPDPSRVNRQKALCPQLESLESDTGYLLYFLQSAPTLSNLNHISILPPSAGPFNFTGLEYVFTIIGRRTGSIALRVTLPPQHSVLDLWLRARIATSRSAERLLHCVKKLELRGPFEGQLYNNDTISLLPAWLALFPALRHIEFEGFFLLMPLASKVAFVRLLSQACPMVETVKFESEVHDVLSCGQPQQKQRQCRNSLFRAY